MSKPEVETICGIKCVPVYDKDFVESNPGIVCDYCAIGKTNHCQHAIVTPCASIFGFTRVHHFRLATPVEIFESEKDDA